MTPNALPLMVLGKTRLSKRNSVTVMRRRTTPPQPVEEVESRSCKWSTIVLDTANQHKNKMAMRTDISFASSAGMRRDTCITVHHDQTIGATLTENHRRSTKRDSLWRSNTLATPRTACCAPLEALTPKNEVRHDTVPVRCM